MSFSTTTGRITGTPTVTQTATTYTITATNTSGSTTATFTLTVVRTCANGGECIVGNTGPGGGIVFYVSATNFTSTGSDCNTTCKYFEAAPTDQSINIVWATTAAFCYTNGQTVGPGISDCQRNSIYSGTGAAQVASRIAGQAIGMGMANTNQIYARVSNGGGAGGALTNTYAAGIAFAYENNGKTDWHLPSRDELNQMCKWQRGQEWVSDATLCNETGAVNSGPGATGFTGRAESLYWRSDENADFIAGLQDFQTGGRADLAKDVAGRFVRPARAFGPTG